MRLSKQERLLLVNQYEILKRLDDSGNTSHYDEMIEILTCGYEVFYDNVVGRSIYDEMAESEGQFVLNILSIYRMIERYKDANPEDKEIADHYLSIFRGFDGNNETEYMSFTRFLIQNQGKFSEQLKYSGKTDDYNSHMPMLDRYREVVAKWTERGRDFNLSRENILSLLED